MSPVTATLLALGVLTPAPLSNEVPKIPISQQIDAVVGRPVLISGLASQMEWSSGLLTVYGNSKDSIEFACSAWPKEIIEAEKVARRIDADVWVTIRVIIRVHPRWRSDGNWIPLPDPSFYIEPLVGRKHYFSKQEIIDFRIQKREKTGALILPALAIQDAKPSSLAE